MVAGPIMVRGQAVTSHAVQEKKTRSRTCTNPLPSEGGSACKGSATKSDVCNEKPCPVNGAWSQYGDWTRCTKTCGRGTQTRSRTCTNPSPSAGGSACKGSSVQSKNCNENLCPVNGGWSNYGAWTSCNKPCGTGQKTRSRTCTNPSPSEGGSACKGTATQSDVCNAKPCPGQY
ncbi:Hypothetical predicted protein [Mytilus galloprovincialis]|uniref:Hemicentin-1 n=1 Tax=Mytilus galloprovincialis TaxID=29158 RepID=A0A8B6D2I7_MYTGA|nr:Hypothetical predicted protein [Mytilus galloprovincialis]